MHKIPTLDFCKLQECEDEYTGECVKRPTKTSWVFDASVPKIATELVEGISARVVVLDGDFYELQASRIHIGEEVSEDVTDYLEPLDPRVPDEINAALDRCADEHVSIEDGVYRVVGVGPGIQGNPLSLPFNMFYFYDAAPTVHENVPTDKDGLRKYLTETQTKLGGRVARGIIGGIVWHAQDGSGRMAKIRLGDL